MACSNLLLFVAFTAAALATTKAQTSSLYASPSSIAFQNSTSITKIIFIPATTSFPFFHDSTSVTKITHIPATTSFLSVAFFHDSTSVTKVTHIPATTSFVASPPPVTSTSIEVAPTPSSIIGPQSSSTNLNPIDPEMFNIILQKYRNITEKVCTNREACCGGDGNTTIIFTIKNCNTKFPGRCGVNSTLTFKNVRCIDALKICTCRAAFLNTSLALVLLGIFLHLVGN